MATSFPPAGLPQPGDLVFITDALSSPADFLLHRLLALHFKDSPKTARCTILSVSTDAEKWKYIAGKSNLNWTQLTDKRMIAFVDILSRVSQLPHVDEKAMGVLREVIDELRNLLGDGESKPGPTLVILDDISSLEWVGIPTPELLRFARALAALCRKINASLVFRHHIVTPGEPDDIFRLLLQICTYHFDVSPLSSGRSGAVSGQIALHPGAGQLLKSCKPIPRSSAVQYKLTDTSCAFFDRGTSSGVL